MVPVSAIHAYLSQEAVARTQPSARSRLESRKRDERRKQRRHQSPESDEDGLEVDIFEHTSESRQS